MKYHLLGGLATLVFVYIIYSFFEYRYQSVKEHYPNLRRWEFILLDKHLHIPSKKAEKQHEQSL